jgi:uncharacterized protein YukE
MAKVGLDPDLVDKLSRDLKAQADSIQHVITTVDGLVRNIPSIWTGKDAQDFEGWWVHEHRINLEKARVAVEGLATSAHNNASEQREVSGR